jgi:hypothetical protein
MGSAVVLHPDGEISELNLSPDDTHQRLRQIYAAIRCSTVRVLPLTTRLDMWLDEEGPCTQQVNQPATLLARRFGRSGPYYGPVVLCSVSEDGDAIDLTLDQFRSLLAHLNDIAAAA